MLSAPYIRYTRGFSFYVRMMLFKSNRVQSAVVVRKQQILMNILRHTIKLALETFIERSTIHRTVYEIADRVAIETEIDGLLCASDE